MVITIRYLELHAGQSHCIDVPAADYFDLDDGEAVTVRSLPRFTHAHQYTGRSASELKWTVLLVAHGPDFWQVRTQFLDGDRSTMTHSLGSDGDEEIINQTQIRPDICHTVRTLKRGPHGWATTMSVAEFAEQDGREESLQGYTAAWMFDEMTRFCDQR